MRNRKLFSVALVAMSVMSNVSLCKAEINNDDELAKIIKIIYDCTFHKDISKDKDIIERINYEDEVRSYLEKHPDSLLYLYKKNPTLVKLYYEILESLPISKEMDIVFYDVLKQIAGGIKDEKSRKEYLVYKVTSIDCYMGKDTIDGILNMINDIPVPVKDINPNAFKIIENELIYLRCYVDNAYSIDFDSLKEGKAYFVNYATTDEVKAVNIIYDFWDIQEDLKKINEQNVSFLNRFIAATAKDRRETSIDVLKLLKHSHENGAFLPDDLCSKDFIGYFNDPYSLALYRGMPKPPPYQILMENKNGKVVYIICFPYLKSSIFHKSSIGGFQIAKIIYDGKDKVSGMLCSRIIPLGDEFKNFLEKEILPTVYKDALKEEEFFDTTIDE